MESERITKDYRLTGITDPNILSWTLGYNADNDITGITDNLNSANSQSLGYDALNHLTTGSGNYGSLSYGYDADGNTIKDGTYKHTYDDTGRLSAVTQAGLSVSYLYNVLGQRVEKTVNGTTTVFLYEESGHLASATTSSGTDTYEYMPWGRLTISE